MKTFAIAVTMVAGSLAAGAVNAQTPSNPYAFTCSAYVAAQQSGERGQANAMLFWATGYLQARLGSLPGMNFTAETFGNGLQDVHAALLKICPNVPDMVLAEFMSNFATDFEKSAVKKP